MNNNSSKEFKIGSSVHPAYGSDWHMLRCLGWHRKRFTDHVSRSIGVSSINWLDFPLDGQGAYPPGKPIRQGPWEKINFASKELQEKYNEFWPGPSWHQILDAVGYGNGASGEELVIVDAYAHPREISFAGSSVREDSEKGKKVREAFQETLRACGFDEAEATIQAEKWLSGCDVYAHRLAMLHFFLKQNIPARLVFLYFCGDRQPNRKNCPQSAAEWGDTIVRVKQYLGLKGTSVLESRVHDVFVDVNEIFAGNPQ